MSYGFGDPATVIAAAGNVYVATPYGGSPMVTKVEATTGTPDWYMCNTNGPYYFSELSAFAVQGRQSVGGQSNGCEQPNSGGRNGVSHRDEY